ncbi:unnamed protein product [Absidia cylindrospora]
MSAPKFSQGTIADINGRLVHATDATDPAFTELSQQQVHIYPSITLDHSGTESPDQVDSLIEKLSRSVFSGILSYVQSRFGDSGLTSLSKSLYDSFNNIMSTQHSLPTDHHLFKANTSPLRAMAWHWHPKRKVLAVAHKDHRVYIYEYNTSTNDWDEQVLYNKFMADITCLDWKKSSHDTLAVACRTGVCVWYLNDHPAMKHFGLSPSTHTYHASSNAYMQYLSTPGHHHISAVAWDPTSGSQTLAVASAVDNTLIMYDLLQSFHTPIKRHGKGNTLLRYSPDGRHLYVACLNGKSRVWNTRNWTNTEIRNPSGLWVKTACWAPDSCSLYYSMVGKQDIHMLYIQGGNSTSLGMLDIKLLSTPSVTVPTSDGTTVTVGGVIEELAIDSSDGTRLAVSYKHCKLLALYAVTPMTSSISASQGQELTLSGYVRGMDISSDFTMAEPIKDTKADHVAFAHSRPNDKLLATVWKNNKISFVSVATV